MMAKTPTNDTDVNAVANEINEYLAEHPNAADSLEGIVTWWLGRQRYSKATDVVQKALELLVADGVVNKVIRKGNKPIYSYKDKHNKE